MSASGLVFVDTNILVYAMSSGPDARNGRARKIYETLLAEDRLCLSTQVLQELYVTLTRKASIPAEVAFAVLEDLSRWPVFTVDYRAIRDAARLAHDSRISFWDALLLTAAVRMDAAVLYTEDLNHGQIVAGVEVRNPFLA